MHFLDSFVQSTGIDQHYQPIHCLTVAQLISVHAVMLLNNSVVMLLITW